MIGLPQSILTAEYAGDVRWTRIKRALSAGTSTVPALAQTESEINRLIQEARTLQTAIRETRQAEERAERCRTREAQSAERNNARIMAARSVS